MKADAETTAAVEAVIERMAEAYKGRDLEGIMACFAPDPDTILFGTGAEEKRTGPEEIQFQVERDWSQTDSVALAFSSCAVSAAGAVAWAALEGVFELQANGERMSFPARVSLVLELRDGRWLIVHSHFSSYPSGQEEDVD